MQSKPILVTGATGYVGGRLVPALIDAGYHIRAMGRSLDKLNYRPWANHPLIEKVQGDVLNLEGLEKAARGCWAAYYLVHSMIAHEKRFALADRQGARNMVTAAAKAGLEKIIYLGGLAGTQQTSLSKHLQSRIEVAEILQSGPVPATHLRSPMILGSGSASFEILRYTVERLPIIVMPRRVFSLCQPIAIRNVITYLIGCLGLTETTGQTFDIGGPDTLSYRELLDIYTEEARLFKRLIIPVPVLSPTLSAYWIHFISPVPKSIALPLAEGLTSDSVCSENRIRRLIPQRLLTCRKAIQLALERIQQNRVDTCWMDAGALIEPEWAHCGDAEWAGGTVLSCGYRARIRATVEELWQPITQIGGNTGWYFADTLWRLRGIIDRLVGGVGLRRGRRHPVEIFTGDALDFWRVLEVNAPFHLILVAEMKTPGEALLEFRITPKGDDLAELQLLSRFMPKGLWGMIYWYVLFPFHHLIFFGMLKAIARFVGKPVVSGPERFSAKDSDSDVIS